MDLYAVIGDPVAHSLSPVMHDAAFRALGLDADYAAFRVEAARLPAFMADARIRLKGFNVTVPHKQAVIPFLDEISDQARAAGSVNTVSVRDGRLLGDTTDGLGLELAVREAFGLEAKGLRILMIGCGGAVHAVARHLADAGAAAIRIANRTPEKALAMAESLRESAPASLIAEGAALSDSDALRAFLADSDLLVQSTSLGLKSGDPPPVPPELIPESVCVFDMIYRETALLAACRARGMRVSNGAPMLLHQGAASFRIWTGLRPPLEAMRAALEKSLAERA